MKFLNLYFTLSLLFLFSCSSVRESAGVNRKSINEYQVIENPPLVLPPDFNLLPSDQFLEKDISNLESDLAQEILFGLNNNEIMFQQQITTMNQILFKADALNISPSIREEIDEDFAQEINTDSIFQVSFEDDVIVLDAVKESERIRNNNFDGQVISDGEISTKTETKKKKKKKRFILF